MELIGITQLKIKIDTQTIFEGDTSSKSSCLASIYIYATPPEKSTVFMGVVRANSRKIFEVEHKFSQHNCFC